MINADTLKERLIQYEKDYADGKTQDFKKVCADCKLAAEMIDVLQTSKATQKRRRQRLSKKNREKNKKIENMTAEIQRLKKVAL